MACVFTIPTAVLLVLRRGLHYFGIASVYLTKPSRVWHPVDRVILGSGIVGSLSSGKSALVHRYLTGSYMQEESPEGGRFKKEVVVDGQSFLLHIRDEG